MCVYLYNIPGTLYRTVSMISACAIAYMLLLFALNALQITPLTLPEKLICPLWSTLAAHTDAYNKLYINIIIKYCRLRAVPIYLLIYYNIPIILYRYTSNNCILFEVKKKNNA